MKKYLLPILSFMIVMVLSGCGHEHKWMEATCTEPKTCSECGETEGEALGHKWVEATCTEPKTCSVCGEKEGDPLGHTWDMATCLHPTTCKVCGFIPDDKLADHACDNWEEVQEATCAEEGYQKGICKYCGKEFTVVLERIDHTFGEWETTTEPTCNSEGEQKRTCSVCELEETKVLPKLEHDLGDWEVGEYPEYGTDGEYVQKCKLCEETINTKPYTFAEFITNRYSLKGDKEGFTVTDAEVYYSKDDLFVVLHALVEITNTGENNLKLSKCSFEFNDDEGHLLSSVDDIHNTSGPNIIKPEEKGYFTVSYIYDAQSNELDVSNGVNVLANITVEQTKEEPVRLEVSDTSWRGEDPTCIGRVTNNTNSTPSSVEILALYRNANGRVISVGHKTIWEEKMAPGDSISFEAMGDWYNLQNTSDINDYEVIAFPGDF